MDSFEWQPFGSDGLNGGLVNLTSNQPYNDPDFDLFSPSPAPPTTFCEPASLRSQSEAATTRFGQITPPDEPLPVGVRDDFVCYGSSTHEEQRSGQEHQPALKQGLREPKPKSHGTESASDLFQPQAQDAQIIGSLTNSGLLPLQSTATPQQAIGANANHMQPAPRRRGRPRKHDPTAYIGDVQVSSAREMQKEKNRVAAHKCRERKRSWVDKLEVRGREYSVRNTELKIKVAGLREELLDLKNELLKHAGCGFGPLDDYLEKCTKDLFIAKDSDAQKRGRTENAAISGQARPDRYIRSMSSSVWSQDADDF